MTKRVKSALLLTDKLMVGKQDQSDPQYTDLQDVRDFLATEPIVLNGYRVTKAAGNKDEATWQQYDEFSGVGDWYPGYRVTGWIKNAPVVDPDTDTVITSSSQL